MKQRIQWLDVAKCFGIFAIYWGHYGVEGGYSGPFVFEYHVPFLFLLSGCAEYLHREDSVRASLNKVFRGLLVPWLVFCGISVVTYVLQTECELYTLWPSVWKILQGTPRNSFVGFGLWFLTCLAVIKVVFAVLRKIKKDWIILVICVFVHTAVVPYVDSSHPKLPFNADIAMYYLLYFGVGYTAFPWINRLFETDQKIPKIISGMFFLLCAAFTAYLYFGRNLLSGIMPEGLMFQDIQIVMTALIVIWVNIVLSNVFQDITCFQKIGRNTLYLCGSEHPIRVLRVTVFEFLGFQTTATSSLISFLLVILTMWAAMKYLIPIEKRFVKEINMRIPQMPFLQSKYDKTY